jgi:hypothetical protein
LINCLLLTRWNAAKQSLLELEQQLNGRLLHLEPDDRLPWAALPADAQRLQQVLDDLAQVLPRGMAGSSLTKLLKPKQEEAHAHLHSAGRSDR